MCFVDLLCCCCWGCVGGGGGGGGGDELTKVIVEVVNLQAKVAVLLTDLSLQSAYLHLTKLK